MVDSLDRYIDDSEIVLRLDNNQRKKFEEWLAKLNADPSSLSTKVEDALHATLSAEWEAESKNHYFKIGSYYPSIIERCVRQQAYSYTVPIVPSKEELAIFSEGKAIHELVASILRQSGFVSVEGHEVVVDLEFRDAKLHGRIDDLLLIRLAEADQNFALYVPLEIKSTSALPDQPKQNHYYQLSTYLLARDLPFGVLLYWAKREGKIKAFTIRKDEGMRTIIEKRVLEIHGSLSLHQLPRKEAALNHDFQQCERCAYQEKCNPYLIESISKGSSISVFDIDTTLLNSDPRRKAILKALKLPYSTRLSDIHDEETKKQYWNLFDSAEFILMDSLNQKGKESAYKQAELGKILVGISPSRRDETIDITRAMLANFGLPISYIIVREKGNFDTDTRFKIKWISRLTQNYQISEYFDGDAVAWSLVSRALKRQNVQIDRESTATSV